MSTSDMKRVAQTRNYYRGDTNITPCSNVLSRQFTALLSVSVILKCVSLLTDAQPKTKVALRHCLLWVPNYIRHYPVPAPGHLLRNPIKSHGSSAARQIRLGYWQLQMVHSSGRFFVNFSFPFLVFFSSCCILFW